MEYWEEMGFVRIKAFTYYTSQDGLKYDLVSKDPILVRNDPIRYADGSSCKFSRIERPNVVLSKSKVYVLMSSCTPRPLRSEYFIRDDLNPRL